jgi:prepilin peptidase CpaA
MTASAVIALIVSVAACITDLRSRRIPNVLTFGSAAAAVIFHGVADGTHGLLYALFGWVVGVAVLFVPFALGGMGGGDIKLLAALGAWLGPTAALWLSLYTGVAGAVMAIVVAVSYGYLGQALKNIRLLLTHWRVMGIGPVDEITLASSKGPKLAYAVPILSGTILTIWLH